MICSICKKGETSVVDSRPTEDGTAIRRRRLCVCGARFTTFERVQFRELMVVKKNGRKSAFDRDKLSKSIYIALKKRPIDTETIEKFISNISRSLEELGQSNSDYPVLTLDPGRYLFLITNDIRYLETNYSISVNVTDVDWGFIDETIKEQTNFGKVNEGVVSSIDFWYVSSLKIIYIII